jgi:hypothetical protein
MGWRLLRRKLYLFKHRREILCAGRSLANTDSCGQPDADAHCYSGGNCHANSHSASFVADTNGHCDTYTYTDTNAKSNTNSETQSNAEVSPHPAAAAVDLRHVQRRM